MPNVDLDKLSLRNEELDRNAKVEISGYTQSRVPSQKQYQPFVHFHLHTFHSILDGCGSIDDYVKLAKQYNHPAIAITDHGTLSGIYEFYKKCKAADIKPILGFEAYVNDNMGDFEEPKYEGGNVHQIILILNKQGYVNANKLAYMSFTEGFYKRGRIKTEWLLQHKEGLFVTTSCIGSKMGKLLLDKKEQEAEQYFALLANEFGDNFAAEIQLNELEIQQRYNNFIIKMAGKYGKKIIITCDCHYAYPEDNKLQDTLIAINQKSELSRSFKFNTRYLYYASSDDLYEANHKFGYNYPPEFIDLCIKNTVDISERFTFEFETNVEKYPRYEPTQDVIDYFGTSDTKEIIIKLAFAKLKEKILKYKENGVVKIDDAKIKEYVDRLNYEISIIDDRKMLDYFMVNWEIVRDYRSKGFEVGVGRGSACGCLLTWCLDITAIDPLRFQLFFERFLNVSRKTVPDLDLDYMAGTDDVTNDFLYKKYGRERILNVSTFSTFNEKGCLKDVAKVFGQDAGFESDVFKVTKEMPDWSKVDFKLKWWFENWPKDKNCSPPVKSWLLNPLNKPILDQILRLQGQIRGIGQHAAGVVITPTECWNDIPTNAIYHKQAKGEKPKVSVVTAFQEADGSGKDLSELGILKLDRLKLETLNVIQDTIKLVKKQKNIDITDKVKYIDLDDKGLYAELRLGQNHGVFQFESMGMGALIKNIKIENFDEAVAANALYRPGPLSIGAHVEYAKNKFNPEKIIYIHPLLKPILEDTKGVMIFQEQVMFIAHKIGGMSLGDGDQLRRAMDKAGKMIEKEAKGELTTEERSSKNYKEFLKYWNMFLNGARKNGIQDDVVDKIKNWMIKYLGYSFNKSHCVSYSYIAAQTLYLKHYYPTEFYASLLNHCKSNNDKVKEYQWLAATISAAMSKGIKIKYPSLKTGWDWTMTGDNEISVGFSAMNGVGDIAYKELLFLLEREQDTLETISMAKFLQLPFSKFNKRAFDSCLKAGVFDEWSKSRKFLEELKNKKKKKRDPKQMALFDLNSDELLSQTINSDGYPETTKDEKRKQFVEACNFDLERIEYMGFVRNELFKQGGRQFASIMEFSEDDYYFFVLDSINEVVSEKGTKYLDLRCGDGISTTSVKVFSPRRKTEVNMYDKVKENAQPGKIYISEFVKNGKGFINFKPNGQFKKVN